MRLGINMKTTNKYQISFNPQVGEETNGDVTFTAECYELENNFFSFISTVNGRQEIVRSIRADLVREVTMLGVVA